MTVLLADDHALVRRGIRDFLATQPDIIVVAEAASGEDALAAAGEHVPDVALVDLVMPGMHGVDAIRALARLSPRTRVVVLTSYHDDEHVFPALRAGALSYQLKDIGPEQLADTIRSAARGEAVLHPRMAARVVAELRDRRTGTAVQTLQALSDRELEVLGLIAEGMSNARIAARLVISEKTVKSHVSNILAKLHLDDRTQAAVFAWRHGIVHR
ncbi:MAG: response regulator transcription factor [Actinomycetota bacterium]|nr:response regulator transcription factor [Actinomycetota bacterium]